MYRLSVNFNIACLCESDKSQTVAGKRIGGLNERRGLTVIRSWVVNLVGYLYQFHGSTFVADHKVDRCLIFQIVRPV